MTLVLSEDQHLLRNTAAEFLKEHASVNAFRALRDEGAQFDPKTWQQMIEFGWPAILIPEALDGLGFGLTGLGLLAVEQGKNLTLSPLQSSAGIAVSALLQCKVSARRDELLKEIASGKSVVAFAHQESHRFDSQQPSCTAVQTENGWLLNGNKSYVAWGDAADFFLVTANVESEPRLLVVDTKAKNLTRDSISLIDANNYTSVALKDVNVSLESALQWESSANESIAQITNVAALLTACELYGCSQTSFERTLTYLGEREQFGQKIGSFQALQHRMAHAFSAMELLKSVLYDALSALETGRKDAAIAVSHAKVLANDTAKLVTTEAIQMHGGIGITDELDIGLFYKRARVLRSLWGDSVYHRRRFAELNGY